MIKCNIKLCNFSKKNFVKAKGTVTTLTREVMLIIAEIYHGLKKDNENAAEEFRNLLFAFLVDPNSPLYKNLDDSEQPEKSPE